MSRAAGIAASPGIAIAKAYVLAAPVLQVERQPVADASAELARLDAALMNAKAELEEIRRQTEVRLGADKAAIFEAHVLVLSDPELVGAVQAKVRDEGVNAEFALSETADFYISLFAGMDNAYMKERAADIKDVTQRVLAQLLGVKLPDVSLLAEEVIVVADDLTPSETAQMDRRYVKGFTTNIGGRTSHSAIMARSLGIPAVVGTKDVTARVQDGDWLIVDGMDGVVLVQPDAAQLAAYQEKQAAQLVQQELWQQLLHEPSVTVDGHMVELAANIGTPDDVAAALANGAEGVGLFRTEFLYMGRSSLPTEEEQFAAYKAVLAGMAGKPVVVRTLDIGGDKELPYLDLPKEMNPFLGLRAIRLCLAETELFRTQIRALLRASVHGNLKMMFPMIATLAEFRAAKAVVEEEKAKLQGEGYAVSDTIELGIMIEIPAAALLADQFAKEVDFFSIGTNDLIQYTMAADRMNEQVAHLYQPFNPALLRLIDGVIQAAHAEGKWVGMCGEMAGDLQALPILLALGLDEFSMSASSILPIRSALRELSQAQLQKLRAEMLAKGTAEEVLALLDEQPEEAHV